MALLERSAVESFDGTILAGTAPGPGEVDGYNTPQFAVQSNYVSWDFVNVWFPPAGSTPLLR